MSRNASFFRSAAGFGGALFAAIFGANLACSSSDGGSLPARASGGSGGASGSTAHGGGGGAMTGTAGSTSGGTASGVGGAGAGGGGAAGVAGSNAGGVGGAAGGAAGSGGSAGSGGPPMCPAGAFFCSGFEDAGLPMGATYLSNLSMDYTSGAKLDTTLFHSGKQSLEILKNMSYSQREIVVPAAQKFWFRAYLQTDVAIGGPDGANHNVFFEAAYQGGDKGVEIVEEDCELGMNINDSRYGSNGTSNQPGCPATPATVLDANKWHCIEGYFDGTAGDFQLYANGTKVIDQTGIAGAKQMFSTLRFGYREYHDHDRNVWYDDVTTAPDRVGCN